MVGVAILVLVGKLVVADTGVVGIGLLELVGWVVHRLVVDRVVVLLVVRIAALGIAAVVVGIAGAPLAAGIDALVLGPYSP